MKLKVIGRILGVYLFFFSLILLIPLSVAIYYDFFASSVLYPQPCSSLAFIVTILITMLLSFFLWFFNRKTEEPLMRKESLLLVVIIWLATAVIGSLPFMFSKTLTSFPNAFFETMSGLTTTGSSVICAKKYNINTGKEEPYTVVRRGINETTYTYYGTVESVKGPDGRIYKGIEAVSRGVVFWRSFIQWLGGMGIVVLFLAVLPALGVGGRFLFQTEVPGHVKDSITPRIKETASILWKIYFSLTVLEVALLFFTNPRVTFLDAVCTTFTNLSTGGFSIRNENIGYYQSSITEWIVIVFMFFGALNFYLYFYLIKGKFKKFWNTDFVFFLIILLSGVILTVSNLFGSEQFALTGQQTPYTAASAIRDGVFQAVSANTGTGFASTDFDRWPFSSHLMLLILMFIGGMSGSTSGGIKTSRLYIILQVLLYKIRVVFRPYEVRKMKISNLEIDNKLSNTVLAFFSLVIFAAVFGTIELVFRGIDPETAISVLGCCLNNIGFAFGLAGPTQSFAFLSDLDQFLTSFWMVLGRLEYFAILLLFMPAFWKKEA